MQNRYRPPALLIENDHETRRDLYAILEKAGFAPISAPSSEQSEVPLQPAPTVAVVSCDAGADRLDSLFSSGALNGAAVVVLTGENDSYPGLARWLSHGSAFFLGKPLDMGYVQELLADAYEEYAAQHEEADDVDTGSPLDRFGMLLGSSRAMRRVYRLLSKVAPVDTSVLVCGESGTGKELVAQTLHSYSTREEGPFLAVNCGAMPADLAESELFGHERGSFSGADRVHRGVFERAGDGTLFLDEITEMSADMQVKLLRVLETRRFRRVGGEKDQPSGARIIAATNQLPEQAVADGRLREDLFYRVAKFIVRLPPLRDRGRDVVGLARVFLEELNERYGTGSTFASETEAALLAHRWPGNVRELKSAVERAYLVGNTLIGPQDLPRLDGDGPLVDDHEHVRVPVGEPLEDTERRLILATLDFYQGDKPETANALGISLKTLYNRLNKYAEQDEGESIDGEVRKEH